MKTKKHKIEVEIPVGRSCRKCRFIIEPYWNEYVCGYFNKPLDLVPADEIYKINRCKQCLEKFGLEEEQ